MKTIIYISFSLLSVQLMAQSVTVKGSISKNNDPMILLTVPVDGLYFDAAADTIMADETSRSFSVQRKLDKPGFASITYKGLTSYFYIEPGKTYQFNPADNQNDILKLTGKDQDAISFFNRIASREKTWRFAAALDTISADPAARIRAVDEEVKLFKDTLVLLKQQGKTDQNLHDIIFGYLDLYRTKILATSYQFTLNERSEKQPPLSAENKQKILKISGSLYDQLPSKPAWAKYPDFSDLMYYVYAYSRMTDTARAAVSSQPANTKEAAIQSRNKVFDRYFKGEANQMAYASDIYQYAVNIPPPEEIIASFTAFKEKFPHSKLSPWLEPSIAKVKTYYQNVANNNNVKYLDNYQDISTFEQLREKLKGRITYIDIWATWCGYCVEEFKYAPLVHPAFKKMNVETLYLSLDVDNANENWLKMVKGMNMGGVNIRAGSALAKDMSNVIPNFEGIPRYIIIGRNGEVLEWDALRPSAGKALIAQLEKYTKGS
ncbi:MAG: TlpA family protein disulfide reductase [Pseudobacter sp.]|uniref:TlpA family protein disulfide reductase n=1 Tax=Pseudobacter sp. TaxID=2045420 RepID=UPI003F81504C